MSRQATEVIRVTPENWERLNQLKKPGDSFNDVVTRLLEAEEDDDADPNPTPGAAGAD